MQQLAAEVQVWRNLFRQEVGRRVELFDAQDRIEALEVLQTIAGLAQSIVVCVALCAAAAARASPVQA